MRVLLLGIWLLLSSSGSLLAQENVRVWTGATLLPIHQPPIENGVLVVSGGKILSMGQSGTVQIPRGASVVDVRGKVIMPGLVDTHSHVGEVSGGDGSSALQPDVRVLDGLNVMSPSLTRARAGGITTVNVMPGSGHLLSGQTVYLKLRKSANLYDLLLCKDVNHDVCGGIKLANGTNPMRDNGTFPGTRARSAAMVRQMFIKAQAYQRKVQEAQGDAGKMPERDLQMEALVQVLEGKRTVHFHTHRHDDILTVIRIAQEFGFKPVLQHVSEGWRIPNEIAASGFSTSIIVIDSPGGKLEALHMSLETGGVLERAGVDVALHTDDYITDSRLLLRSAALAVRGGMSRTKALEGVTLAGARMLGMADRIGSLEAGKDADFIILSGDPLSVYTNVEETWIEGQNVFNIRIPEDRAIAKGAYGVLKGDLSHTHHDGEDAADGNH